MQTTMEDNCKGHLPSLRHVVNQGSKIGCKEKCVPESQFNPLTRPIDPFGNDYTCMICDRELANNYFHCEGCKELLLKEYKICDKCFTEEKFKCNTALNDDKLFDWASNFHHIGKVPRNDASLVEEKGTFPCVLYAKSVNGVFVIVTGISQNMLSSLIKKP